MNNDESYNKLLDSCIKSKEGILKITKEELNVFWKYRGSHTPKTDLSYLSGFIRREGCFTITNCGFTFILNQNWNNVHLIIGLTGEIWQTWACIQSI